MHGGRMRSVSINLAVLVVATCLAALCGELMVRAVFGNEINLFPRYHTNATYGEYEIRRLRPNAEFIHTSRDGKWKFRTNAQGFRSERDFSYAKAAGTTRILSLGDSQTQGFEVRQARTFSAIIERYLKARGINAETLNTGVSGFSTAEALIFLENEGIRYEPDFVVLGFFANDFGDNVKADLFGLEAGRLVEKHKSHVPGVRVLNAMNGLPPLRWLSENSYLYSFLLNTAWERAKRLLLSRRRAELQTEYALPKDDVGSFEHELTTALVQRMHSFCRDHGVKLIIVDIPKPIRGGLAPSIPKELEPTFRANADVYIDGEELLAPYDGVAEIFVPHGQRHISEFSHLMIGIEVASAVLDESGRAEIRRPKHPVRNRTGDHSM